MPASFANAQLLMPHTYRHTTISKHLNDGPKVRPELFSAGGSQCENNVEEKDTYASKAPHHLLVTRSMRHVPALTYITCSPVFRCGPGSRRWTAHKAKRS